MSVKVEPRSEVLLVLTNAKGELVLGQWAGPSQVYRRKNGTHFVVLGGKRLTVEARDVIADGYYSAHYARYRVLESGRVAWVCIQKGKTDATAEEIYKQSMSS